MITYQDLLAVPENDRDRAGFVRNVISQYQGSALYLTAKDADAYDRCRNVTIMAHQNMVATVTGQMVPDRWRANHKAASNFFSIFTTQLCQYLLGNGVTWKDTKADKLFGNPFDTKLQKLGRLALMAGVAFGFWNLDHMDVFSALEFAPMYDEENGALAAGVRFWQVSSDKPLRATLYEMDGYTDYLWSSSGKAISGKWTAIEDGIWMRPKRPYKLKVRQSEADGEEIYAGENYPAFPIIPLYGNDHKQSELIGMREKIDAYDLILNGFENDLDNAQIYWIIKGAGGMDDPDLMQFLDRLRVVGAAAPSEGQEVQPVTVDIPYDAREKLLDRLEKQLYRDAMIMNPDDLASSAATATQIRAAYERQNSKADMFEYCVLDFLDHLLQLTGIEDDPTFTRSIIVNTQEEIQSVVMAASYLSEDYVTRKILNLFGDGDQAEDVIEDREAENMELMGQGDQAEDEDTSDAEADMSDQYLTEFGDDVMAMLEELMGEL